MRELNNKIRALAYKKFDSDYVKRVIRSDYEEDKWEVDSQVNKVFIDFNYRNASLRSCAQECGISEQEFIIDLKTTVILRLGTCSAYNLRRFVRTAIESFINSRGYTIWSGNTSYITVLIYLLDFVELLPYTSKSYIAACQQEIELCRKMLAKNKRTRSNNPCVLNEFKSYFKLIPIIDAFWKANENTPIGDFYFPFFLYWQITTILPMRVTEFCLTPYDCIRQEGELYYLTIRRSNLKGSTSERPKIYYYTIDKDYSKYEYEIPYRIYKWIENYKTKTANFYHPYQLLFSVDYTLQLQEGDVGTTNKEDVFTSDELRTLAYQFYDRIIFINTDMHEVTEEILTKRYVDSWDGSYEMYENEIMRLQLKHTRHLAMINLIMRGCNPRMIRAFAGHTNDITSAHYYGNVSKLVRCATKVFYDRVRNRRSAEHGTIQKDTKINPLSVLIDLDGPHVPVDGGNCYSEQFISGEFVNCNEVSGRCKECRFFWPDEKQMDEDECKQIDQEMNYLIYLLKSDRIEERITEFQLRAQNLERDIANLATRYWRELMMEESINGKENKL